MYCSVNAVFRKSYGLLGGKGGTEDIIIPLGQITSYSKKPWALEDPNLTGGR